MCTTAPDRAVQQSRSHTFLVPQEGTSSPIRKFGLASETRQTIAPITLFKGTPQEFTIETAGEWVLRATADGNKGSVFYGPGKVTILIEAYEQLGLPDAELQLWGGPNSRQVARLAVQWLGQRAV